MEVRYRIRVGDREYPVVLRERDGEATLLVCGRQVRVRLEEGAPGIHTLLVDGRPYDLAAVERPWGYEVAVDGEVFELQVEDERLQRLASLGSALQKAEGRVTVKAPMPGLVVQVEVAEGDSVEAGQRLLVLEAMKMENDVVAPRAGRVVQVGVSRGEAVEQGQPLAAIE
ncbi:MAG: biotin/lipoyl-containing protein [Sphingomonadaceae bacterium]